ncbi:sugar phosphate isomerase/epimerase family protein [Dactylosporangium matsuzakiense]|uniref:Xylose isomerase n=1 Tax=Dactylosporangium matsuzakiense TaxID=53360 RepID=A0A9W6KM54_9ACTN|nr:sugar phosphate isomerase/epimerase family protein [Dactylosporangium matsuzakiense]UWZ46858.1 sugar phosphate isomerase/epimerase [Dactylosporangium matsuzakiense]GLL01839.1 xylose isomerase [Dactylosporangium matsuzakiense]
MSDLSRFSLNQATTKRWPMRETVAGCVAAGVPGIGLWRDQVDELGVERTAALVRSAGLTVTTLCRGGFFTADGWRDDNLRAIDEAAALGAPVLVLVSGGLPPGSRDVDGARRMVADAIAALVPHAEAAGVQLAIEPLHPMFASDRCVIATLGNALDIADAFPAAAVGVVVDTYHLWWDDQVWTQLARAGAAGRIACFQVADWITPLPEGVLLGRGLPGTGCVELRRFREAVDAAGYRGPIEVEVFHEDVWSRPGEDVLAETIKGYLQHVL